MRQGLPWSSWSDEARRRTAPSADAVRRVRARLALGGAPVPELHSLPPVDPAAVARVRERLLARPPTPAGWAWVSGGGLLAVLLGVALWWSWSPVARTRSAPPPAEVADILQGSNTTVHAPQAPTPAAPAVPAVRASAPVVAPPVAPPPAAIRSVEPPPAASSWLAIARRTERDGGTDTLVLQQVAAGLSADGLTPPIASELHVVRLGAELRGGRQDAAAATVELALVGADPVRSEELHRLGARLHAADCTRAVPHLLALRSPTADEAERLARCGPADPPDPG